MLGFSASDVFAAIAPIPSGGLSTKQYDTYRGQVWSAYANQLVNVIDSYRANGQLTYSGLATYLDALQQLVQSYVQGTDRFRPFIKSSWIEPRFHDFYDPMVTKMGEWQAELTTLPDDTVLSIISGDTGMPLPEVVIPDAVLDIVQSTPVQDWYVPPATTGDQQIPMSLDAAIESFAESVTTNVSNSTTEGSNMLGFTTQDAVNSVGDAVINAVNNGIDDVFGSATAIPTTSALNSKQYDAYRQQVWDVYALKLVNVVDDYIRRGQLTYSGLSAYIHALEGLIDSFVSGTNKFRMYVKASWIDPRFHDFYDPMVAKLAEWKALLTTLPSDILTSIFGGGTNMPAPQTSNPVVTGNPNVNTGVPNVTFSQQQPILGGNTLTYVAIAIGIYLLAKKR